MEFRFYRALKIYLETSSVLQVGNDKEEEIPIAMNKNGQPIIPGSSIAGTIKAYLKKSCNKQDVIKYMGSSEQKSKLYFYDAEMENYKIEIREGICQDPCYGGAEDKKKYSSTFVAEGAFLELIMEGYGNSVKEDAEIEKIFGKIVNGIRYQHIAFGGKQTNGAGLCKIRMDNGKEHIEEIEWDLSKMEQLLYYLRGQGYRNKYFVFHEFEKDSSFDIGFVDFEMMAKIEHALLVKGEMKNVKGVNSIQNMKSFNKNIIPASTMKGALRGFSEKISNLFGLEIQYKTKIFGNGNTDDCLEKQRIRGRVFSEDVKIDGSESHYHRIKINRWLGCTMNGAKITESPIVGENVVFRFRYLISGEVQVDRIAVALLYLFLRELGVGHISIGSEASVGYGRFLGKSLKVTGIKDFNDTIHNIVAKFDLTGSQAKIILEQEDKKIISNYLSSLQVEVESCS